MNGHVVRRAHRGTDRELLTTSRAHYGELYCTLWNPSSSSVFFEFLPKRNSRNRSWLALVLSFSTIVLHHTPPEMDIQGPIKVKMGIRGEVMFPRAHNFALSGTNIFCDLRSNDVSLVYGLEEITCDHRNFRRLSHHNIRSYYHPSSMKSEKLIVTPPPSPRGSAHFAKICAQK